jgi:hypothetical protein
MSDTELIDFVNFVTHRFYGGTIDSTMLQNCINDWRG